MVLLLRCSFIGCLKQCKIITVNRKLCGQRLAGIFMNRRYQFAEERVLHRREREREFLVINVNNRPFTHEQQIQQ